MPSRVFFYDDWDLSARRNLELVAAPVEKLGAIGWEMNAHGHNRESVFAGSVVPMPGGGYRAYHSSYLWDDYRTFHIGMAESADGLTWTKPKLGQVEIGGQDTNLLRPGGMPEGAAITQPQVCRIADGEWRMWYWWHGHDTAHVRYVACTSRNGVDWRVIDLDIPHIMHPSDLELGQAGWVAGLTAAAPEARFQDQRTMSLADAKRLRSNDATYVYYDERTRGFEMYSVWLIPVDESTGRVTPHDNAPMVLRIIQRRESPDGIAWSDPEIIIMPDEHDPLHQQFYHLAVQPDGDWHIGLLGNYRCWEQTMDIEICFSRDSRQWTRPLRGGWVPRGGPEDIDYYYAYPTNRLIDEGDSWLLLYDAGNAMHNGKLPEGIAEEKRAVMGARTPKGRFAGLRATPGMVGALTLKPFMRAGERITIDADIRGRLQAELRDPYGRPLPGYELNACAAVTGDSQCHELTWAGGKTGDEFQWDVCVLRIEIEDGVVYSVGV